MAPQREWLEKDYYAVLGVAKDALPKDVTKAYRKLARQFHPDANPDNASAEERFKEISAAYDVLGDEARRKEYDEVRAMGPMGGVFGGGGPGGFTDGTGDISDLLGGLFGRVRNARRPPPGRPGPRKGADLESELKLSFAGAVRGVETSINLTSDVACSACGGSGAKPGTAPRQCPTCGGRGVTSDDQGFFSFSQPCAACRGQGYVIDEPCPTCRGGGIERKARAVKVRVPTGVRDGQRIRLTGRGGPGRDGGPAGDLFVIVRVAEHPLFGRKGDHLTVTVPITFPEAALGADVVVPTLDGPPVTIKVPAGSRSGRTLRVRGMGVVPANRPAGDLLATIEVAVPAKLSSAERKAVEALAAATTQSPRAHLGV